MSTLILNVGSAAPINVFYQGAGKGTPIVVGGKGASFNGGERSWIRGQRKVIGAVTTYVDVATEAAIQALSMNGAQVPCTGDILGNLQTVCSIDCTSKMVLGGTLYEVSVTLYEVNPSVVLLKYSPGDTISGEAFTRSTTALYVDPSGIYQSAAINVKRDAHYIVTTRTLLLEGARTNSCLWSRDLTNAAWTKTGTTTQTLTAIGLDGTANSATIITDTDAAVSSSFNQAWAVGNNNNQHSVAAWFRKDSNTTRFPAVGLGLSGGTAVSRQVHLNTQTGAITNSVAPVGTTSARVIDVGLWWVVEIVLTNNTTGNVTLTLNLFPAAGSVFGTNAAVTGGTCTVGQVNAELNVGFYSSPIFTTTTAVPRGGDLYSLPFTAPPQELSVYTRFTEIGRLVASEFLFQIGNAASAPPRFIGYPPAGLYTAFHDEGVSVSSGLAVPPSSVDTIEFEARLFGDGSVDATQSLNGAAATSSVQSGPNPFPTGGGTWSGPLVWLNSAGTAGFVGFRAFQSFKIVAGARSLPETRVA